MSYRGGPKAHQKLKKPKGSFKKKAAVVGREVAMVGVEMGAGLLGHSQAGMLGAAVFQNEARRALDPEFKRRSNARRKGVVSADTISLIKRQVGTGSLQPHHRRTKQRRDSRGRFA